MKFWCGLAVLCALSLQSTAGEWQVMVDYVNYTAPRTGSGSHTHCDGTHGQHAECDPIFHMCRGGSHNLTCADSAPYNDTYSIQFGKDGSTLFPPHILDKLPARYVVDVKVYDYDGSHKQLTVHLSPVSLPKNQLHPGASIPVVLHRDNFSLALDIMVQCRPPHVGPHCDCLPNGNVLCNATTGAHYCADGWAGHNCRTSVTPCHTDTCMNGGTCEMVNHTFLCHCAPGFSGKHCQNDKDDCLGVTCQNGGTCFDNVNGFVCVCPYGVMGRHCETVLNGSLSVTCHNGGTKRPGSESCQCPTGFSGLECEVKATGCLVNPCHNGGRCAQTATGTTCLCSYGFSGAYCQHDNTNHCKTLKCAHGGTCHYVVGVEYCHCAPGFKGETCQEPADECVSAPCLNGGTCEDGVNSFRCLCPPGYTGSLCQMDPLVG